MQPRLPAELLALVANLRLTTNGALTGTRALYLQATLDRAQTSSKCDNVHRSTRRSELTNSESDVQRVLKAFH